MPECSKTFKRVIIIPENFNCVYYHNEFNNPLGTYRNLHISEIRNRIIQPPEFSDMVTIMREFGFKSTIDSLHKYSCLNIQKRDGYESSYEVYMREPIRVSLDTIDELFKIEERAKWSV